MLENRKLGLWEYIWFYRNATKRNKKAQEKDTWHAPHNVKRAIQQIKCTLAHLDRYRNWTDYYEWPEAHMEECEEKDPNMVNYIILCMMTQKRKRKFN